MELPSCNPTVRNLEKPDLLDLALSWEVGADTSRDALKSQAFGDVVSEFQKDGAYWDLLYVILQTLMFCKGSESENTF